MRSPNEVLGQNSPFRYAPLKVLGKSKQIILRIEFTQNFGLDFVCHAPGSNYLLQHLSCARQQLSFAAPVVLSVVIALVFVHHGVDLVYDA